MKKTAGKPKSFRDHDGYECGNRRVRISYLPGADIDAKYEGKNILGGYLFEDMQVDIREEMADPQAVASIFHEGGHDHLQNAGVEHAVGMILDAYNVPKDVRKALIELVLDTLGQGWAEVAFRNPEFWRSLSLGE